MQYEGIVAHAIEYGARMGGIGINQMALQQCTEAFVPRQELSEEQLAKARAEKATAEHEYNRKKEAVTIIKLAEVFMIELKMESALAIDTATDFYEKATQFVDNYKRDTHK